MLAVVLLMALPLLSGATEQKLRLAIDIGHSVKKGGAISARGKSEFSFNRDMAFFILEKLKSHPNINPFILNPYGKYRSLASRAVAAKKQNADLFISIHHDSVQPRFLKKWTINGKKLNYSDKYSGHSLFISNRNGKPKLSSKFAHLLGVQLLNQGLKPTLHHAERIPGENRRLVNKKLGIYRFDKLAVLRKTIMPAVLLECGIIVNRKEEKTVSSSAFKEKITNALTAALEQYLVQGAL